MGEPLFSALMDQICVKPETKEEGLRKFQKRGWLLVDAIYQPVNKLPDAVADELISRNYWRLRDDLNEILSDRSTPLILVKKNVCELLERRLTAEGFNVLNGRKIIPFPLYRRRKFREIFAALVKAVKV